MKRAILGVVTASLLATSAMAAEYVMKISHVVSSSTPKGIASDYLEKRIEELTNGRIDVQVFPNSQLYGDGEEMKALVMNNVQVIMPSLSKFTSIAPQMQLFDLPFIFRDKAHLYAVMDGEVGAKLKSFIDAKKQMLAFDYWDAGFKHFSSSKQPIVNPEDAKGLKFRIQSSKVLEAQFKAVGGNPQILPFSEVYSALQQGVVDATENPLSNLYTKKFHEVQSSVTLSSHGYLGYLVVMNQQFFNKLPKDLQEHVKTAMKEATELERRETAIEDAKIIDALRKYAKDSGRLEIYELNDEQVANWRRVMSTVYPQFYKVIGEDLIKQTIETK
ncbi:DctP family TRAP transporter solute-binding subunit [Aliarcobacter skirrowii]|jgi:C4-dicarboxylate-binding protein DctP|uniref:TRAP transporter, substrate binding protein, DctP family n=2 Tax=Aliarcobacter skirrowii TaxID=28200 RepID=A0AAD0WNG1_9BACT|nr:DctP family TRAP transporter solute-binding subunit [Aliarcobacter skirrowii]AXX84746.1 TRAP transporter, substrate binding protein, DctP family [Aliarcobacter skirrowii CCUG 10374]KAB0620292.1 DctP family TRAP transporter solute-binding subunit [Aliarcobacter skirrowii CCUG 10374]MDX3959608.1 DctP family TRAP transporter solute-binding subunit [Aliarcobacter skirrowii]MDX4012369.1 DctP family TRAP transporter solute-binding subunit [Aliarcobacter skirrowii]MDX4036483.1 DctP family TRAP tra